MSQFIIIFIWVWLFELWKQIRHLVVARIHLVFNRKSLAHKYRPNFFINRWNLDGFNCGIQNVMLSTVCSNILSKTFRHCDFVTFCLLFQVLSKGFFFYLLNVMYIRHWNYRSLTCCLHLAFAMYVKRVETSCGKKRMEWNVKRRKMLQKNQKREKRYANVYFERNIQWQWKNNSLPFGKRYKPNGDFRSILFSNSIHVLGFFVVVVVVATAVAAKKHPILLKLAM